MEAACDSSEIDRIDLGLGAEGYKERFATGVRQTLHLTASKSVTAHLGNLLRYRLVTAVKRVPELETWLRNARAHAALLRKRIQEHGP